MSDIETTRNKLDQFVAKIKKDIPGVSVMLMAHESSLIEFQQLIIPKKERRRGHGKAIFEQLTTLADTESWLITLTPSDVFGTPAVMLNKMYRSYGFSYTRTAHGVMTRIPYTN